MDLTLSESIMDMKIHHFSHQHPLVFFIQDPGFASCFGCARSLQDSSTYACIECNHFLHKECAELELAPHIHHPFHSKHHLSLYPKFPYRNGFCDFCYTGSAGFVYHCASCGFDLHVNCASLQSSVASDFPTCLHQHPLFFFPNNTEEIKRDCSGCTKPLSGPVYRCGDCSYPKFFSLHKECAELPLEINHPYDPTDATMKIANNTSTGTLDVFRYRTLWSIRVMSIHSFLPTTFQASAVVVSKRYQEIASRIDA
ncbi:hypothetical protein V6N13_080774 [Hibiscus sabdariffa]